MRLATLTKNVVALSLFASLAALPARAQVVYDNGAPDFLNAVPSNVPLSYYVADTFTFSSPTSFDTIVWYGVFGPASTPTELDNFGFSIFNTTGGTPDQFPFLNDFGVTGFSSIIVGQIAGPFGPNDVYEHTFALPSSVSLEAGTYGLEIVNYTNSDPDDNWFWLTSAQTGEYFFRTGNGDPFQSSSAAESNGEMAFRLVNTAGSAAAPEPGTLALLGLAAIPALVARRRGGRRSR